MNLCVLLLGYSLYAMPGTCPSLAHKEVGQGILPLGSPRTGPRQIPRDGCVYRGALSVAPLEINVVICLKQPLYLKIEGREKCVYVKIVICSWQICLEAKTVTLYPPSPISFTLLGGQGNRFPAVPTYGLGPQSCG